MDSMVLSEEFKNLNDLIWREENKILSLIHGNENHRAPLKVGVFLSGGPASGGHNVLVGLYHALQKIHPKSELIGFLGGPKGLLEEQFKLISKKDCDEILGTGGFHFLGTGRTKIEGEDQFRKALQLIEKLQLTGLVCVGGDDTNTNAYHLSVYLKKQGLSCPVVGVPKTIDGDVKSKLVPISFGFDTATKVYSELIGNICIDAASSLKYWHFIKLMGRSASHVTLECALKTHPNRAFISEEVSFEKQTLHQIVSSLADLIESRALHGKKYGVVLVPEGLIESIGEIKALISELNRLLAENRGEEHLSRSSKAVFDSLPESIRKDLLCDRDPHGNVQVSKIETEKLLSTMTKEELIRRGSAFDFSVQHHFFGYEGRCSIPSCFDANYTYHLGFVAALLIKGRKSGYMAAIHGLHLPLKEWHAVGVPLESMMTMEERKGEMKRVVQKAYAELEGPVFKLFKEQRKGWELEDRYQSPGPMQLFGKDKDVITKTLELESK